MRPDPSHHPLPPLTGSAPADSLDRLWAATRPDDPSPALLDALWASAARELDRIEATQPAAADHDSILNLPPRPNRRRWVAWAALAQAAVILLVVGFVFAHRAGEQPPTPSLVIQPPRPITPTGPVGPIGPNNARPMIVVAVDQTLLVRIDREGNQINLLAETPAFPMLPEGTPHDVYNAMESMDAMESMAAL